VTSRDPCRWGRRLPPPGFLVSRLGVLPEEVPKREVSRGVRVLRLHTPRRQMHTGPHTQAQCPRIGDPGLRCTRRGSYRASARRFVTCCVPRTTPPCTQRCGMRILRLIAWPPTIRMAYHVFPTGGTSSDLRVQATRATVPDVLAVAAGDGRRAGRKDARRESAVTTNPTDLR
jgi:hypothetical protein